MSYQHHVIHNSKWSSVSLDFRSARTVLAKYLEPGRTVWRELSVQLAQELNEVDLERCQPVAQLNHIESAFAPLTLLTKP